MKTMIMVLAMVSAGCGATYYTGKAPSGITHERMAHKFLYGLVGPDIEATGHLCGDVSSVRVETDAVGFLARVFTFGLYAPYNVIVACASTTSPPQ